MMPLVSCLKCDHYEGQARCEAFAGTIPDVVLDGDSDHSEPIKGDHGIRFQAVKETATKQFRPHTKMMHIAMSEDDIPEGDNLKRLLKRWYRRIARHTLREIPHVGVTPGHPRPTWSNLSNWQDPLQRAVTPIISAWWDDAGKRTRAKLGLDPDQWRVTDPHIQEKVEGAVYDFCEATLDTTGKEIDAAYDDLHEQMRQGVVEEGESYKLLKERVKVVFEDLSDYGCERIARTESVRAENGASLQSAKDSGVVSGKRRLDGF